MLDVPSMEGLAAAILTDAQVHWDEFDAVLLNLGARSLEAKPFVHGDRIWTRVDRELAEVA